MLFLLFVLTTLCQQAAPISIGVFLPQACLDYSTRLLLQNTVLKAILTSTDATYKIYDSCSESEAISDWVTLLNTKPHDVLVGPGHAGLCEPIARLASYDSLPLISWHCAHPPLAQSYPYFLRTIPSARASASGLNATLRHFRWQNVALVLTEKDTACWQWGREAYYTLTQGGLTVAQMILLTSNDHDAVVSQLSLITSSTKAIVMCVEEPAVVLRATQSAGLTTGSRALFLVQALTSPNISSTIDFIPSWIGDVDDSMDGVLDATFVVLAHGTSYLEKKQSDEPEDREYSAYDTFLYDAIKLAVTPSVLSTSPTQDQNVTIRGLHGNISLSAGGDMRSYVTIWDYDRASGTYRLVVEVSPSDEVTHSGVSISWPGGFPVPPDPCFLEDCDDEGFSLVYVVIIFVVALLLVGVALLVGWLIRRQMVMKELERGPNKILLTSVDLVFVSTKTFKSTKRVDALFQSMKSNSLFDKPDLLKASEPSLSQNSFSDQGAGEYSELARFNGELVYVKELFIKGFEMKGKVRNFIKQMREMRHENTTLLIGCYVDQIKPGLVWEHCSRRSLEDVIHNEDIKLDWDFKLSLLTDLVKGMRYLHGSVIKYHGCLKSGNCVIDSRWVLKITDYGLNGFYERYQTRRERVAKDLLWSAPELLRDEDLLHKGTQKGDVFSFAIITQELILRGYPYCMLELDAEEIVRKVRKPPPLIRPSVSQQAAPPQYIQIMKQCWTEMPEMRPDFETIHQQFKDINKGKKLNIVDTMFKMLEKYSTDLEDIVRERTVQLEEEKKKTENLLSEMLPPSVAKSLMMGHRVDPEAFEEVTIYFSDIVGFTTISAMSTPLQVVDLLNDLYTMFDSTIDDYDVYKVETIGDAYMVVSGLPKRNGDRHAGEISTLSLDLLSQCGTFRIRHLPEIPLRLRIGLHTGPCVSGVVGLRMPRYCLFGDTVNTASRMESTGAAFRIHISETTKLKLDILGDGYILEYRGQTELKGKGMHNTYWLQGKEGFTKPLPEPPPVAGGDNHGLGSLLPVSDTTLKKDQKVPIQHETIPEDQKASPENSKQPQSPKSLSNVQQNHTASDRTSLTSLTSIGGCSPVKKAQSHSNLKRATPPPLSSAKNMKKVKSHSSIDNGTSSYEVMPIGKLKRASNNSVTTFASVEATRTLSPSPITIEEKYPTSKV